jgi:Fe-S oxidoreductase
MNMSKNMTQTLDARKDFLSRCSRCSQCKFVPVPKSQRHASSCPSIDYGQLHAYSGGGQVIMAYALLDGKAEYSREMLRAMSSCTMCGHCDTSCKVNFAETVEPLDSLYALRAHVVATGHSPEAHCKQIDNLKRQGNATGHERGERARWADGLPPVVGAGRADVVLHIGSTLAYDSSRWSSLRSVVKALHDTGIAVTHLGATEGSSGSLAFDLGYVDEARTFAQTLIDQVQRTKASTLVTFSAPALAAFRAIYPRLGLTFGSVRVLHFTEYVQELVATGRLKLAHPATVRNNQVAYHDPCKLGRLSEPWQPHDLGVDNHMNGIISSRAPASVRFGNDGCYEPPRALLRAMGLDVVELERNRAASYCCGGCGGVKETVPEAAALAARNRLAELSDTPTTLLVSGCSGCSRHLGQHVDSAAQVVDLLALLAQALQPAHALTN